MRLWHQLLIPYLDRQRLLSQHRECCALRGKGWGRNHATVNYVFEDDPSCLFAYHVVVMNEMEKRGYKPDPVWRNPFWRGTSIGEDEQFADPDMCDDMTTYIYKKHGLVYDAHNDEYLRECVELLRSKGAECDWDGIDDLLNRR